MSLGNAPGFVAKWFTSAESAIQSPLLFERGEGEGEESKARTHIAGMSQIFEEE